MHKRIKHIQNKIEMSDNKLPGSNEYEYLYLYSNNRRYDLPLHYRCINIQMHMYLNQKYIIMNSFGLSELFTCA